MSLTGRILWPTTERLLGRDTMHRLRVLQASERCSRPELENIQAAKLRKLLVLAEEHCPFYRERFRAAGVDVRNPDLSLADLARLPLLERADLQEHLAEATWHDCLGGPAQPYCTGGSTGQPLKFYIDRCRQASDWGARWRHRNGWGLGPGDREVMLWAGPMAGRAKLTRTERLRLWRDRLLNQFILDAFNMTEPTMNAYVHRIMQLRPRMLYGYSSSLALLARHMLGKESPLPGYASPRAIFVTGETITRSDIHDIQAAFGAPVVTEYGSRDCGFIAGGCEAGRLHVVDENVIVEVLDEAGQPVAPGQTGEIAVTCLESFATPLIRYRVGDLALVPEDALEQKGGRCACGRASHQLMEIRGRVTDQIVRREKGRIRRMHALFLIYVLREAEGVRQFRITQNSISTLEVEVITDSRFTPAVEGSVLCKLRERMGEGVEITIHKRDSLPPIASGKHACVVSKVSVGEDRCQP